MNIAVIDGIAADRDLLSGMIKMLFTKTGCPISAIRQFSSGEDFLKEFKADKYDIIFLDIYLKGLNGIETAEKVRLFDQSVKLVFSTSSNDFASESYAVCADGYILKPYKEGDLLRIASRLHLPSAERKRVLTLPDGQTIELFSILYTSYSGHYVSIYLADGKCVKTRMTQREFSRILLAYPGFLSCNPGMLVSLKEVGELEQDCFIMSNGFRVPISRRRYCDVKKAYSGFKTRQIKKVEGG